MTTYGLLALWLTFTVLPAQVQAEAKAQGQSDMVLNQTIQSGESKKYDHASGIVLSNGFWAKTGSDVTATITQTPGFSIDKTPLDAKDKQYTSNDGRTFIVAGCVPHKVKVYFIGSHWIACNDLDEATDRVVESKFISCLDTFDNGVVQEFFLKEVNNRTWQSFRFSCGELKADGTVGGQLEKTAFLFDFEKEGKPYTTTVPAKHLSFGMLEMYNQLQLLPRENLLQIAIEHASATAILEAGEKGRKLEDFNFSDKVPNAFGLGGLIGVTHWQCPPGMIMTGAAIGHVPDKKDKHTRPVYILGECRRLLKN